MSSETKIIIRHLGSYRSTNAFNRQTPISGNLDSDPHFRISVTRFEQLAR
jgi:hypothetical protein